VEALPLILEGNGMVGNKARMLSTPQKKNESIKNAHPGNANVQMTGEIVVSSGIWLNKKQKMHGTNHMAFLM
jgi:hypothetical protein